MDSNINGHTPRRIGMHQSHTHVDQRIAPGRSCCTVTTELRLAWGAFYPDSSARQRPEQRRIRWHSQIDSFGSCWTTSLLEHLAVRTLSTTGFSTVVIRAFAKSSRQSIAKSSVVSSAACCSPAFDQHVMSHTWAPLAELVAGSLQAVGLSSRYRSQLGHLRRVQQCQFG